MGNPLRFRISAFVSPLSANFSARIWLLLAKAKKERSKSCREWHGQYLLAPLCSGIPKMCIAPVHNSPQWYSQALQQTGDIPCCTCCCFLLIIHDSLVFRLCKNATVARWGQFQDSRKKDGTKIRSVFKPTTKLNGFPASKHHWNPPLWRLPKLLKPGFNLRAAHGSWDIPTVKHCETMWNSQKSRAPKSTVAQWIYTLHCSGKPFGLGVFHLALKRTCSPQDSSPSASHASTSPCFWFSVPYICSASSAALIPVIFRS